MDQTWQECAARGGVEMTPAMAARLERYLDLLLEGNARMNLTRIVDRGAARLGHVADALTVLGHLPRGAPALADVGSGGGVPGMVLAIARPDAAVTLIESTQKKAKFLSQCAAALELANVRVEAQRAETLARGAGRAAFDVVVARAVGGLEQLLKWCWGLVKPGGVMLAMKGPRAREEIEQARAALSRLGAEATVHDADVAGLEGHVIVRIEKRRVS